MKDWMIWLLVIMAVINIAAFAYWLTSTLSIWWCNGIVIVVNFIVSVYLILQKKKQSN